MITYRRIDHDPSLDTLLLLDGETFAVEGNFWVKFEVKRVSALPEKPHGLDYSLTLHDGNGERLLGFDNAHPSEKARDPAPEPASNTTISGRASESAFTSTRMQCRCWRIFGKKLSRS
jgi:hypothetical protein